MELKSLYWYDQKNKVAYYSGMVVSHAIKSPDYSMAEIPQTKKLIKLHWGHGEFIDGTNVFDIANENKGALDDELKEYIRNNWIDGPKFRKMVDEHSAELLRMPPTLRWPKSPFDYYTASDYIRMFFWWLSTKI